MSPRSISSPGPGHSRVPNCFTPGAFGTRQALLEPGPQEAMPLNA
jgi:hypothetical protein